MITNLKTSLLQKRHPWLYPLGLLTAVFSVEIFLKNINLNLTSFKDRTIGITVLSGFDASKPSLAYAGAVFLFILAFLTAYLLLVFFTTLLERRLPDRHMHLEKQVLFYTALCAAFYRIYFWTRGGALYSRPALVTLLYIIAITFIILSLKTIFYRWLPNTFAAFKNPALLVLLTLLPLPLMFLNFLLLRRSFTFVYMDLFIHLGLFLLLAAGYYGLRKFLSHRKRLKASLDQALLWGSIPLLLIPFSIPLIAELQYSLADLTQINTQTLALVIVSIEILLSIGLFYLVLRHGAPRMRSSRIIALIYFPILVATVALYQNYHATFDMYSFDIFHFGEMLLPVQQAFQYSSLPFVDIFPTHGLSDFLIQFFYASINGYRPVDPFLWYWIYTICRVVLIYFVFKKLSNPTLALFLVSLLPITLLMPANYGFFIIMAFLLIHWMQKPILRRSCLLWVGWLACFLWRPDYGIATLAGIIFIAGVWLLFNKSLKAFLHKLGIFLAGSAIIGLASFLAFAITVHVRGQNLAQILKQIAVFLTFQGTVAARSQLFASFTPLAAFQYLILPTIAAAYVLAFVLRFFKPRKTLKSINIMMTFLALATLVLSVRTTQRHSLVEDFQPMLFIFLLASIPFLIKRLKPFMAAGIFMGLFLFNLMLFPATPTGFKRGEFFTLPYWQSKEPRVGVYDTRLDNISAFLSDNLYPGQTFLDVSENQMLYITVGSKFPSYFTPMLYHTSEPIQEIAIKHFQDQIDQKELPFVIFKGPEPFWNNIDGVPGEIRIYRIAELIYANYEPFITINGYQIWAQPDVVTDMSPDMAELRTQYTAEPVIDFLQIFELKQLPLIWGSYDPLHAAQNTIVQLEVLNTSTTLMQDHGLIFDLNKQVDKDSGNYIHLRLQADQSALLVIMYGADPQSAITLEVPPSGDFNNYLVRISAQWAWASQDVQSLTLFAKQAPIQIESLFIRQGD